MSPLLKWPVYSVGRGAFLEDKKLLGKPHRLICKQSLFQKARCLFSPSVKFANFSKCLESIGFIYIRVIYFSSNEHKRAFDLGKIPLF
jgi:hypothetical protein